MVTWNIANVQSRVRFSLPAPQLINNTMRNERHDELLWESHNMGPTILVIDDSQSRHTDLIKFLPKFNSAYSKEDAIRIIGSQPWSCVFLDHDLDESNDMEFDDPNSGSALAHTLVYNADKLDIKLIVCHSLNPDGRENMVRILSGHFNVINAAYMGPKFIEIIQQLRRST